VIQGLVASRRRIEDVADEFTSADMGDERLNRRLLTIADAVAAAPSSSFPQMTGSDGELEGVYRFLSNERVTPAKILAPHFAATVERAASEDDVLVIHDSSLFTFGGESPREGLGRIHKQGGDQGFLGHFAFAVSGDGTRRPLGLVGVSTVVRTRAPLGRNPTRRARAQREGPKESSRWPLMVMAVHDRMPDAIHVMDREADGFPIYETLLAHRAKFVIRGRDRQRQRHAIVDGESMRLPEVRDAARVKLRRTVPLSRRRATRRPDAAKRIHPPRNERVATLEIRCSRVTLPRPWDQSRLREPRFLDVNVVWVTEVGQPAGDEPVSWMLVTNLPTATERDLERIVDAYRARWVIEEFFKALKTGCAFEKRQLESFKTLVNALAMFTVVAWRLLLLRFIARTQPQARATEALSERQVEVLQALASMPDAPVKLEIPQREPTAGDVLLAVARLGGHLPSNGDPGWLVLGRGLESLLLIELGWRARNLAGPRSQT